MEIPNLSTCKCSICDASVIYYQRCRKGFSDHHKDEFDENCEVVEFACGRKVKRILKYDFSGNAMPDRSYTLYGSYALYPSPSELIVVAKCGNAEWVVNQMRKKNGNPN